MTGQKPDLSKVRVMPQAKAKPATLKKQLEAEIANTEQELPRNFSNARGG
jgi:hypothetical protein